MFLDKIEHAWMFAVCQMNMCLAKAAIILICWIGQIGCLADMLNLFERNFGIIVADIDFGKFLRDLFQNFSIITKRNLAVTFQACFNLWWVGIVSESVEANAHDKGCC